MEIKQSISLWIEGARPKTIPAAIVPVIVGTSAVADGDLTPGCGLSWIRFLLALFVSVALQVGVNYANDYSDGLRGADHDRIGPRRLVGSGLVDPGKVKNAAVLSFAFAALAGLSLVILVGWWLIFIGLAAILAAWFYTGGSRPYGYMGFGEIFVFIFFGLVATIGSAYVQIEAFEPLPILLSLPVGFLATALLVTNNLRDLPKDKAVDKKTLAVRLGGDRTRILYAFLIYLSAISIAAMGFYDVNYILALGAAVVVFSVGHSIVLRVLHGAQGKELIGILESTGKLHLLLGVLVSACLWISAYWL
ncbi:MAG: 1,4-dihydroxy-2-naphthoate polyprenyltransferase [Acidimicrobiales bacterium]|nr:1,4-dihydroxy-2-naphthoate polyprenyltransferase [Acidimicrobiales bacterium]